MMLGFVCEKARDGTKIKQKRESLSCFIMFLFLNVIQ